MKKSKTNSATKAFENALATRPPDKDELHDR